MRLLLDTHAWFWWTMDSPRLPPRAKAMIADRANVILLSAVSIYELVRKFHLGRLPEMEPLVEGVEDRIDQQGFERLAVTTAHALKAASLVGEHRDPFDRLLIAQSLIEEAPLITNEVLFEDYGVIRVWS